MSATATAPAVEAAERRELTAVARELAEQDLAPRSLALDEQRPEALDAAWRQVREIGFDRALLPVEQQGAGIDPGSLLLCLEEIAAGDAGVAMQVLLANAALAAMPAGAPTPEPGERWALVPVGAGPPAAAPVALVGSGGGQAQGSVPAALGALGADGVVLVGTGPEAAVLAIPSGAEGLRSERLTPQLGLRAAAAARLHLSAATGCPAGEEEAGAVAAAAAELLHGGAAAIARGVARRAHRLALDYAENRIQGGVPIVEHDAVRQMLAAMAVRLAAPLAAAGGAAALAARVAEADAAVLTTTDAVQVFGGAGYMHETGVEKLMRDAKWLQLWPRPTWLDRDALLELLRGEPGAPGPLR